MELRLAGIYALERIANDSEKDRDAVSEVLSTYVRENAHFNPADDASGASHPTVVSPTPSGGIATVSAASVIPDGLLSERHVRADIQTIMTVLGRRTARGVLDLRDVDLRHVYLQDAHLEGANLWNAHFEQSGLGNTHLDDAYLVGAHFELAFMWDTHLDRANLDQAVFTYAQYLGTDQLKRAASYRGAQFDPEFAKRLQGR